MPCRFCGKVIRVDMYRHVARLHLYLVQLWRCPIAWCTTWKGSPQDCLEHVRSGHDAPWVSKTASIEKHRKRPASTSTLGASGYVFVRRDSIKPTLQRPYDGPYKVLESGPKFYKLDNGGRCESARGRATPTSRTSSNSTTACTDHACSPHRTWQTYCTHRNTFRSS